MNVFKRGSIIDGRYLLRRQIGEGASCSVWCAFDFKFHREVALKVFTAQYCDDESRRRRAIQEARAGSKFEHPNVVRIFDIDCYGDSLYIVSELLRGQTLEEYIRNRRCQLDEALELLWPIFEALDAAHGEQIVHRDIKPANIFLSRDANGASTPVLLDFGVAKIPASIGMFEGLTSANARIGTLGYASVKALWTAGDCGPADDVHALACTLYEMLAGELPDALRGSRVEAAARLADLNGSVPARVASAICRGLRWELDEAECTVQSYATFISEAVEPPRQQPSAAEVISDTAVLVKAPDDTKEPADDHQQNLESAPVVAPAPQPSHPLRTLAFTALCCATLGAVLGTIAAKAHEPTPHATVLTNKDASATPTQVASRTVRAERLPSAHVR